MREKIEITSGPWYASPTAGHEKHGQSAIYAENGITIAIVYDGEMNSQLIAAAPELLEACKYLVNNCEDNSTDDGYNDSEWIEQVFSAIEQAKAAIKKALGE